MSRGDIFGKYQNITTPTDHMLALSVLALQCHDSLFLQSNPT